jgi:hypothetical protein
MAGVRRYFPARKNDSGVTKAGEKETGEETGED